LNGEPGNVLSDAENLSKTYEIDCVLLDPLKMLLETLNTEQLESTQVLINLGLTRGIAYYTGMIFEIKHEASKDTLCGGGRYDDLVRALGGEDIPALGFAYWIESIAELCEMESIDVNAHQT
jgi:histidyl-tRNA synthetase